MVWDASGGMALMSFKVEVMMRESTQDTPEKDPQTRENEA